MRDYELEFRPRWEAALDYLGLPKDMSMTSPQLPDLIMALADKLKAIDERIDTLAPVPRETASGPPLEDEVM